MKTIIDSDRSYGARLLGYPGISFVFFAFLAYKLKFQYIWGIAVFFVLSVLSILRRQRVEQISVSPNLIEITYYKWAVKKTVTIEAGEINTGRESKTSRGGKRYQTFTIYKGSKPMISVDGSDGFSESDFDNVVAAIREMK